jgi:DNA-binding ferritin-like protein
MNKQIEEMAKDIDKVSEFIVLGFDDAFIKVKVACERVAEALYEKGYRKASDVIDEFAEKIKTFYHNLSGKTVGGSVEYHIDQIAKEMKGEQQ